MADRLVKLVFVCFALSIPVWAGNLDAKHGALNPNVNKLGGPTSIAVPEPSALMNLDLVSSFGLVGLVFLCRKFSKR